MGPVAPLVESVAGGVQVHGCGVLDEGELDLIAVPGLRQGLAAVGLAKPLGSGLFTMAWQAGTEWSWEEME